MKLPKMPNIFSAVSKFDQQIARTVFNSRPIGARVKDSKTTEKYTEDGLEYALNPLKYDVKHMDDQRPKWLKISMNEPETGDEDSNRGFITASHGKKTISELGFSVYPNEKEIHVVNMHKHTGSIGLSKHDIKLANEHTIQQLVNFADSRKLTIKADDPKIVAKLSTFFYPDDRRNATTFERSPFDAATAKNQLDSFKHTAKTTKTIRGLIK